MENHHAWYVKHLEMGHLYHSKLLRLGAQVKPPFRQWWCPNFPWQSCRVTGHDWHQISNSVSKQKLSRLHVSAWNNKSGLGPLGRQHSCPPVCRTCTRHFSRKCWRSYNGGDEIAKLCEAGIEDWVDVQMNDGFSQGKPSLVVFHQFSELLYFDQMHILVILVISPCIDIIDHQDSQNCFGEILKPPI